MWCSYAKRFSSPALEHGRVINSYAWHERSIYAPFTAQVSWLCSRSTEDSGSRRPPLAGERTELLDQDGLPIIRIDRSALAQPPPSRPGLPVKKNHPETPMLKHLKDLIAFRDRPLTMAEYMKEVLVHPTCGFYMTHDVFGEGGDFTTSPEISQMFGEMIGVWCVYVWHQLGRPEKVQLVELGPGRGTLMADLLRSTACFPDFERALEVSMVEVSGPLRRLQWRALKCARDDGDTTFPHNHHAGDDEQVVEPEEAFGDIRVGAAQGLEEAAGREAAPVAGTSAWNGRPVTWRRSLSEVPPGPMVLLAHELFDALPVHQLKKTELHGWCERLVDVADHDSPEHLQVKLSKGVSIMPKLLLTARLATVPEHVKSSIDTLEVSPQAWTLVQDIANRVSEHSGAALLMDYGREGPLGDSLQAIRRHEFVDLLDDPGGADLSAHVDFGALREAVNSGPGKNAVSYGPVTQSELLHALGISARLEALLQKASPEERKVLEYGFRRLVSTDECVDDQGNTFPGMGESYKALAITSAEVGAPPGFAAQESTPETE